MYCESCGTFIPDGDAYCSCCGAKAPVILEADTAVQPVQPTQPVQSTQPAQPVQFAQPVPFAQPVQSPQPVQPVKPMSPVQSMQPVQPLYQAADGNPVYGQNTLDPIAAKDVINYNARTALILGIVSVVSVYIPFTNIIPAILSIIFALKGLKKTEEFGGKGNCIAAFCLSAGGITLTLILLISVIINNINS